MKDLEIIIAQQNILKTILKMQSSVSEIIAKNPHRIDLINSMNESIDELNKSLLNHRYLENSIKTIERLNLDWSMRCLKAEMKLEEIEKKQQEFKVNEDYILNLERENMELKNKLNKLIQEL